MVRQRVVEDMAGSTVTRQNVLYITYDGLLEPLGASQVIPYVVGLADLGYTIEILSFEKETDKESTSVIDAKLRDHGVLWTRRPYHNRPSLPATLYDVVIGAAHALWRALATRNLIIHARGYLPALMALPARGLGARLLFDTRGLWIDERIESGHWAADSRVVQLARLAEKACVARADGFVHLTSKTHQGLSRNVPNTDLAPYRVIPTCADLERFVPPIDRRGVRADIGLPDVPTLVHSGTISGWYLSDLTFQVGAEFVRRTGGTFLVLTREAELAQKLAAKWEVPAIVKTLPQSEMSLWLQACDAGIALVRPSFAKTASCPTKVGEYLGVGLAVAVTRGVGDLDEQLGCSPVAVMVSEGDSVVEIVDLLLASIGANGRVSEARKLSSQIWDLGQGVAEYHKMYSWLSGGAI